MQLKMFTFILWNFLGAYYTSAMYRFWVAKKFLGADYISAIYRYWVDLKNIIK